MELTNIDEIRALLARHGFRFSKSLGQNFLCQSWVPEDIAASAELDGSCGVLEIGPGIGCLTRQLSMRAKRVVSVELDLSLKPILSETLSGCENVEVVFGDIMKTNLTQLCHEHFSDCERICVCANLPYNITSPVLTRLISSGLFNCITVMIQREVAERICARPGTADYGAFTLLMQWYTLPEKLFDVPPSCFIPAPKVTSSVIRLRRLEEPPCAVSDEKLMFSVIRAAFNQRRKTLSNALGNCLGGFDKAQVAAAISACGLDERVRGETLTLEQFARLSDELEKMK